MSDLGHAPLPADLFDDVHQALSQWGKTTAVGSLGRLHLVQRVRQTTGCSELQACNQVLLAALDLLERQDAEGARVLRLRFLEGLKMYQVANRLNRSEPVCYKLQRRALERVSQILASEEQQLRIAQSRTAIERLGLPPYGRLFGVGEAIDELLDLLRSDTDPWLILLEGIGGIGKTSLADAVLRQAIANSYFNGYGWVTARPQVIRLSGRIETVTAPTLTADDLIEDLARQVLGASQLPVPLSVQALLPQLRQRLDGSPHLIVVDNLETVTDLLVLLPTLRLLAKPSKLLLTSRRSLQAESIIYRYSVPELAKEAACDLVRHEARLRNATHLIAAGQDELDAIYSTVGGNPLALRLIVGQSLFHDLPSILDSLKQARGQPAEQLFTYIYRQAWEDLDDPDRCVLLLMPLTPPQGADIDLLTRISGIDRAGLQDSLSRLVQLNLVDRGGDLQRSRYSIHPLTQIFLQEQAAKWR